MYDIIISLGCDCLFKQYLTEMGYKPRKAQGELTLPFDLAVHTYESAVKILDTDFEGYLNTEDLYISDAGILCNKALDITFIHESQKFNRVNFDKGVWSEGSTIDFIENGYARWKERYAARISNWNTIQAKGGRVLCCFHTRSNDNGHQLLLQLQKRFANVDLVVLNTAWEHEFDENHTDNFHFYNVHLNKHTLWNSSPQNESLVKTKIAKIMDVLGVTPLHGPTSPMIPIIKRFQWDEFETIGKFENVPVDSSEPKKQRNIVIFANCHGLVLRELLKQTVGEFDIRAVLCYKVERTPELEGLLRRASVFIYMRVYKGSDLSTFDEPGSLLECLDPECERVVLTNAQNNGLWSQYPCDDGDYEKRWNDSLAKFKSCDEVSDTPVFDFFLSNYKRIKLFLDRPHPTMALFYQIYLHVCRHLCIHPIHVSEDELDQNQNPCQLPGGFSHTPFDIEFHGLEFV